MRLPLLARLLAGLLVTLGGSPPPAWAQSQLALTTDVPTQAGGAAVRETTLALLHTPQGTWGVAAELAALLPTGVGIDAVDLLSGGRVVFSTDAPFLSSTGLPFKDEDLVLLDGGVLSFVAHGSSLGLGADVDLDAVAVVSLAPLDLYFSVDVPVAIAGTIYGDDDILRVQERDVSLAVAGATLLGDEARRADLDALALDPVTGHFLFSTDVAIANVGGLARAEDEDVVEYTGSGLALAFDLSAWGIAGAGVDVRAIAFAPGLFSDGFESGSTGAWSARVP